MKYELINYCEFDKYATKSYSLIHNEPESKNLGDITQVNEKEIADFNMMVGGSPCQDFSVAGKGEGAVWTCKDCKDENKDDFQYNPLEVHYTKRDKCPKCNSTNIEKIRSSLVVEWLRILLEKKPNLAMYENVKNLVGKKHRHFFDLFIAELHEYGYNTYWKVLNAKDYGIPQNRERVYLVIIKKELDNGKFKFPEGFDNGIRLKDILLKEVDEKYYISQDKVDKLIKDLKDKNKINSGNNEINVVGNVGNTGHHGLDVYSETGITPTLKARDYKDPIRILQIGNIVGTGNFKNPQRGRIYSPDGICPTLNTCGGGGLEPKILEDFYSNRDVREYEDYSPTLRADRQGLKVVEESPVPELVGGIGEINFGKQYRQGNRVYDADKTAMCLLSQPVGNTGGNSYLYLVKEDKEVEIKITLKDGKILREILKTVPENEVESMIISFSYGNYSCDCNRSILMYGKEKSFDKCSEGKIRVEISSGNYILYSDFNDITNDKEAIENISSEYQFAKDKCIEYYNKHGHLPEMFNPYNQAEVTDVAPTQTTSCNRSCSSATVLIKDVNYRIRKLTPLECFRLMAFSDKDFYILKENGISDSQCYKMAGNSIVAEVLYHILLEIHKAIPYLLEDIKLSSFFSGIGAFEKAIIRLQETIHNQINKDVINY